jgi:hypothetical protein
MKVILSSKNYDTALEGLEKIETIDVLEDGTVMILYTVRDNYMKEHDLLLKHRILQINTNLEDYRKIQDYGNIMED